MFELHLIGDIAGAMKMKLFITLNLILFIISPIYSQQLQWISLPDMPTARVGHCSVVYQDKIWIIGGKDDINNSIKTIDCYNLRTGEWESEVSELIHARYNAAAVVYDNKIFVIGGHNNRKILNSVEYYDPDDKKWKEFTPLIYPREGATAVVFNGKLYALGGASDKGMISTPLADVEYWDGTAPIWQESTTWRLEKPRVFMQSVVFGEFVYTFGGLWIDDTLDLVERFGQYTGTEFLSRLPIAKFYFSAVRVGMYIYVLGGIGNGNIDIGNDTTIYYYEPEMDQWHPLAIALSKPRSGLSAVHYNESIYIFGGMDSHFNVLNSAQCLTIMNTSVIERIQSIALPTEHRLLNNYPNPFNSVTTISFQVAKAEQQLQLVIYNLKGERICTYELSSLAPGIHQIQWDGRDENGRILQSGIYLVQLRSSQNYSKVLKLSFIK